MATRKLNHAINKLITFVSKAVGRFCTSVTWKCTVDVLQTACVESMVATTLLSFLTTWTWTCLFTSDKLKLYLLNDCEFELMINCTSKIIEFAFNVIQILTKFVDHNKHSMSKWKFDLIIMKLYDCHDIKYCIKKWKSFRGGW